MTKMVSPRLIHLFFILLIVALACNLPSGVPAGLSTPIGLSTQPPANLETATNPSPPGTVAPATAAVVTVMHVLTPPNTNPPGAVLNDVDSSVTASQNRAPYGDSYNLNLFERPFTQTTMTYIPALDIQTFSLSQDNDWYYVTMALNGGNLNDPMGINYGVELDTNHDGIGDYLVWAYPPYATTWTTDTVRVYSDPNHDVGGASPEKSDANATTSAPYPGDGYETIIFDKGKGPDPDLAWVRLDPANSSVVQFAFKRSLAGKAFMWGVWADSGLKDPSKFNYNDRFTLAQAGSPIKNSSDYPVKAIYQVDNTCWSAFGFKVTGFEPHLCPVNVPVAKTTKVPGLTGVPVLVCPNPNTYCVYAPPGCPCQKTPP
jgi:hypothetical protein